MGVSALETDDAATLSITPNVTEANPEEEVNFTFKLSKVTNLAGLTFTVDIPEGLTYKSYALGIGTSALGVDSGISFTENVKKFVLSSPNTGYTSSSETTLMTITCSVANNASGNLALTASDLVCCDLDTEDISTIVVPSGVIVCAHENKTEVPAVPATCTQAGNNKYYICDDCHKVFKADGVTETTVENETIAALGHNYGEYQHDANEHWKVCSACGDTMRESHTLGDPQKENAKEATCTENGSYDEVVYCSECNLEMSRDTKTELALGHDYQETVKQEGTADRLGLMAETCSRCGVEKENTEKLYVKEGTSPSKYPDGSDISGENVVEAKDTKLLDGEEVEVLLQDPLGALDEGYSIEIEKIVSDELGADYDGNYAIEKAYKANIILRDEDGNKKSGQLNGYVRLLLEIPEGDWDDSEIQALRINSGADTEYVEEIEYRLYDADGNFIKVVDKDYKPEAGQKVRKFIAIWTDHFSDYALVDPEDKEEASNSVAVSSGDKKEVSSSSAVDSEGEKETLSSNAIDLDDEEEPEYFELIDGSISGSKLKTGQDLSEVYFLVVAFSLGCLAVYFSLKKIRKVEGK